MDHHIRQSRIPKIPATNKHPNKARVSKSRHNHSRSAGTGLENIRRCRTAYRRSYRTHHNCQGRSEDRCIHLRTECSEIHKWDLSPWCRSSWSALRWMTLMSVLSCSTPNRMSPSQHPRRRRLRCSSGPRGIDPDYRRILAHRDYTPYSSPHRCTGQAREARVPQAPEALVESS